MATTNENYNTDKIDGGLITCLIPGTCTENKLFDKTVNEFPSYAYYWIPQQMKHTHCVPCKTRKYQKLFIKRGRKIKIMKTTKRINCKRELK